MEHDFWSGPTADFGAHVCCRQKPWAGGSNSSVPTRHVPSGISSRARKHSNGRKQLLLKIIPRRVHKTPLHIDNTTTRAAFRVKNETSYRFRCPKIIHINPKGRRLLGLAV